MPSNGLKWIATQTFSGVSSVSFNNCFSATYFHYLIKGTVGSNQGESTNVQDARFRSNGSDNTSAIYDRQRVRAESTTISAVRNQDETSIANAIGDNKTGEWGYFELLIHDPFEAIRTNYAYVFNSFTTGSVTSTFVHGVHKSNSSFDGITFFIGTGTMTGDISVWGLVKS